MKRTYYTIYDDKENIVAFGFAEECAAMMGRSVDAIHNLVSRSKLGRNDKYKVVKELVEEDYDR